MNKARTSAVVLAGLLALAARSALNFQLWRISEVHPDA